MRSLLVILAMVVTMVTVGCNCDKHKQHKGKVIIPPHGHKHNDNVTMLLRADSCGCKVYAIEHKGRTIYVNNAGGIVVIPKKENK